MCNLLCIIIYIIYLGFWGLDIWTCGQCELNASWGKGLRDSGMDIFGLNAHCHLGTPWELNSALNCPEKGLIKDLGRKGVISVKGFCNSVRPGSLCQRLCQILGLIMAQRVEKFIGRAVEGTAKGIMPGILRYALHSNTDIEVTNKRNYSKHLPN